MLMTVSTGVILLVSPITMSRKGRSVCILTSCQRGVAQSTVASQKPLLHFPHDNTNIHPNLMFLRIFAFMGQELSIWANGRLFFFIYLCLCVQELQSICLLMIKLWSKCLYILKWSPNSRQTPVLINSHCSFRFSIYIKLIFYKYLHWASCFNFCAKMAQVVKTFWLPVYLCSKQQLLVGNYSKSLWIIITVFGPL